jgi:hypothetical protein
VRRRAAPGSAGRYTRRGFLGVAGGTATAVAVGLPRDLAWSDLVAGMAPDRDLLAVLGRAYLKIAANEASVDSLFERVPGLSRRRPAAEQLPELQARITSDFARQRTVSIDGWRLARTEARIAALHALGR